MILNARRGRAAVGHPVDVATGTFFNSYRDFAIKGIIPLLVTRFYNTRFLEAAQRVEGPFGQGWRCGWLAALRETLDGFVYTTPEGDEHLIPPLDNLEPDGRGLTLASGSGFELKRIGDRRAFLASYGIDRHPTELLFEHTRGGHWRLTSIRRTSLARIDIIWDANRVTGFFQTREQRSVHFEYDKSDRLRRAEVAFADRTRRLIAEYGYDAGGRLVSVSDGEGVRWAYTYDDQGRMVEERSRAGARYSMRYDRRGRCSYVSGVDRYQERTLVWNEPAREVLVTNSHGATTKYVYAEDGQVVSFKIPSGAETRFEYDSFGRLIRHQLPSGGVVEVKYDDLGRLTEIVRPDGARKTLSHDARHRLIQYVDQGGYVIRLTRDEDHHVSRIDLPDGPPWNYEYSAWAEPVCVIDPLGSRRRNTYDDLGNVISTTTWEGQPYYAEYDGHGNTIAITDPVGHKTTYAYDSFDRLVRIGFPDGRTWERRVNISGTDITYVRSDGQMMIERFAGCGQIMELVDEGGQLTRFEWDTEPGRLLAIVNPKGERFAFSYNVDGLRERCITFDGRVYQYIWQGERLVATIDPSGRRIEYEHDVLGRLMRRIGPEGPTEYRYNSYSRPTEIISPSATLRFTYDARGGVIGEDQDGVELRRSYDEVRNLRVFESDFGDRCEFDYDRNGDTIALHRRGVTVRIERDAHGWEIRRHLPGAGILEQSYDPVGRLLTQAFRHDLNAQPSVSRSYQYDRAGLIEQIDDLVRGETRLFHDSQQNLVAVTRSMGASDFYEYDPCGNRVLQGSSPVGAAPLVLEWVSKPRGLRGLAEQTGAGLARYEIGPGNRLVQMSSLARSISYEYDARGQVIRRTVMDQGRASSLSLEWDSNGRMTEAHLPDGGIWRYRYDGLGRRIEKIGPTGEKIHYVWDKFRLAYECPEGQEPRAWIHIPHETGGPILLDDGRIHYVLSDGVEAPSEMVSAQGEIEEVVHKGSWGEDFTATLAKQPYLGHWFDQETGFFYNVFRYYDPQGGRYLSPDPIGPLGGLNDYVFVADPHAGVDPWGLVENTALYNDLRTKSPSQAIRDSVNQGEGTKTCPVLGTQHDRLDADHIVPLSDIVDMPGFSELSPNDQLEIANMRENFEGIGSNANRSRRAKSWKEWEGHSTLETRDAEFVQKMIVREAEMREKLQREIEKRLPATEDGC